MRDALTVVLALLVFVGLLSAFLWPLRAIVQSVKVRGLRKIVWVALWFGGFLLGGIVDGLLFGSVRHAGSGSSIVLALMPVAGVLPVWAIYALFRSRTRNLSDLQSRAQPIGLALGKRVRALLDRHK